MRLNEAHVSTNLTDLSIEKKGQHEQNIFFITKNRRNHLLTLLEGQHCLISPLLILIKSFFEVLQEVLLHVLETAL